MTDKYSYMDDLTSEQVAEFKEEARDNEPLQLEVTTFFTKYPSEANMMVS